MRRNTKKRAALNRQADKVRKALKDRTERCECCGMHKQNYDVHEIVGGPLRKEAMDKLYAVLVLCRDCHRTVQNEPTVKQLARLYLNRQADYDLRLFNWLVNPRAPDAVEQCEVDVEIARLVNPGQVP